MKQSTRHLLFLALTMIVPSCSNRGIGGIPTILVKPDRLIKLAKDEMPENCFKEVLNCLDVQVVSDTVLLLQNQVGETDDDCFKAYSTKTLNHIGSFIKNGRGPGEMISPHIVKVQSGRYLNLRSNSPRQSLMVDIPSSLTQNQTVIIQSDSIPLSAIDLIALS